MGISARQCGASTGMCQGMLGRNLMCFRTRCNHMDHSPRFTTHLADGEVILRPSTDEHERTPPVNVFGLVKLKTMYF